MKTATVFILFLVGLTQATKTRTYSASGHGGIIGVLTGPTSEDIQVSINVPADVEVLGTFSGVTHDSTDHSRPSLRSNSHKTMESLPNVKKTKAPQDEIAQISSAAKDIVTALQSIASKSFGLGLNFGGQLKDSIEFNHSPDEVQPQPLLRYSKQPHTFDYHNGLRNKNAFTLDTVGKGLHVNQQPLSDSEEYEHALNVKNFGVGLGIGLRLGSQLAKKLPASDSQRRSNLKSIHQLINESPEFANAPKLKTNENSNLRNAPELRSNENSNLRNAPELRSNDNSNLRNAPELRSNENSNLQNAPALRSNENPNLRNAPKLRTASTSKPNSSESSEEHLSSN